MNSPNDSNQNKRNKRWRRFRNKKSRPQNPQAANQAKPQQNIRPASVAPKPQQSPKPASLLSLETIKRSQARETLPPDYKLPEDLDIPTYNFHGLSEEEEALSEVSSENAPSTAEAICPLCNYPIKKFYTTVRHPTLDALVHFDCALRELFHQHKSRLAKDQRIYYIGGGRFAIVKEVRDKRGNLKSYQVIEKIEYEKHG
jgi:hypothetical protein